MLVLAITQRFFKQEFEQVVLINQGINDFKQYEFEEGKYNISLPNEWSVEEKKNEGQYVSYELNFKDKDNKINGFMTVINTKAELGVFAEADLNNQHLEYYNSQIMPFKNSNNAGVLVKYDTSIKNGYNFRNECYYLNLEEGKTVKILFNIKESSYKENMKSIFNTIISSIKVSS
jgi:hypothetical protein